MNYLKLVSIIFLFSCKSIYAQDYMVLSKDNKKIGSKDSLIVDLYLLGVGGCANNTYWSSTENDSDYAWRQIFYDGRQSSGGYKNDNYDVRAVRAF